MDEALTSELLKAMVPDGGGFSVIKEDAATLHITLIGTCTFCPSRWQSAKALGERIKNLLPQRVIIEAKEEVLFDSS